MYCYRPGVNIPASFASSKVCSNTSDQRHDGWWMRSAVTGRFLFFCFLILDSILFFGSRRLTCTVSNDDVIYVTGHPMPCILNLTNTAAKTFWVEEYIGAKYGYDDPHAAGVFIDGGNPACSPNNFTTLASQQVLFNATVLAWREAAARLNTKGKVLIISMQVQCVQCIKQG